MNRKLLVLFAVIAGVMLISLRSGPAMSTEEARELLNGGALLVDVRTPQEFAAKKLPGALNIPLDTLKQGITACVSNKAQVVLLHCRSGRRSTIAEKELRSLGYSNVFNIGSFERAQKVVAPDPSM